MNLVVFAKRKNTGSSVYNLERRFCAMKDKQNKVTNPETENVSGGAPASGVSPFPVCAYVVDPALCVRCGTCVIACPVKVISMTEISAVIRGHCIECGACTEACLANAIKINR